MRSADFAKILINLLSSDRKNAVISLKPITALQLASLLHYQPGF